MDHTPLMGVMNRVADRAEHSQPDRELCVIELLRTRGKPLIEREATHELHGKVVVPVVGVTRLVDCGNVGVSESGQRLGLTAEHLHVELVDHVVAAHDLECDQSPGLILLGLPHHSHTAASEPAEDPEPGDGGRLLGTAVWLHGRRYRDRVVVLVDSRLCMDLGVIRVRSARRIVHGSAFRGALSRAVRDSVAFS